MRADRLLSLLMLLQARGRLTAQQLARELEVSVRTIYRDIDALSTAGVPVYTERGPGGGCELIDDYRTNLTGLTEDEVRALFMLSVPAALDQLGVSGELKAALRKLAAALPAARRRDEEMVRGRIHLDWAGWSQPDEPVPHLQVMQQAVWQDRRLQLAYRLRVGPHVVQFERTVDPYGLVAKAGVWHLVCAGDGRMRVYRVSRLLDARVTDDHFERPADFDLGAFWESWCVGQEERRPRYPVTARVAPELVPLLPLYFGERIRDAIVQAAPPDAEGWIILTLPFERLETARERILGFGRAVEILEPQALRQSIIDFATQIAAFYAR
ncbi:MAG: WYL domain-containing protein [Gammaproteobacteria bacterium]|nr:WYL domain-containing protein [Gammaproteobacteria bacterium]